MKPQAIRELKALLAFWEEHQWRPIEEMEDKLVGDSMLLIEHHTEEPFVGHWDGDDFVDGERYLPKKPTHFAPIPEALEGPK